MPDFTAFDGTDREPRPIQVAALKQINEAWRENDVIALVCPVGGGKSFIARSIQVATGADIITPANLLIDQYMRDYPHVNVLKGRTHYRCKSGLDCKTWKEMGFESCENCPYECSRQRATDGESTFYNPMSLYYQMVNQRTKGSPVLVVDEAHTLASMLLMLTSKRLRKSEYKFTEACTNELVFVKWLADQIGRLDRLAALYYRKKDMERLATIKDEIEILAIIKQGFDEDPQNFVLFITKDLKDTYLNIKPLFPPKFLTQRLIGGKKLILMSGTLFDHDIKALVGDRPYTRIEQGSPIPKKNRRVIYKPAPFKINYQTDPTQLVRFIEASLPDTDENVIIHTTYSLSKKLAPLFTRPIIYNSQEDKEEKLQEFKDRGGIFLAAGCAEGLDLKGDLCRHNIVFKLAFPDLGDPAVQKRKALQDGDEWYSLTTLATLIQQVGRSTRGPEDFSTSYVLDPNFGRLFHRYKHKLPRYFVESVEFV